MCSLKQPGPYVLNSGNGTNFFPEKQVTKGIEILQKQKIRNSWICWNIEGVFQSEVVTIHTSAKLTLKL